MSKKLLNLSNLFKYGPCILPAINYSSHCIKPLPIFSMIKISLSTYLLASKVSDHCLSLESKPRQLCAHVEHSVQYNYFQNIHGINFFFHVLSCYDNTQKWQLSVSYNLSNSWHKATYVYLLAWKMIQNLPSLCSIFRMANFIWILVRYL